MSACPPLHVLEDAAAGKASVDQDISSHLVHCSICRRALDDIRLNNSLLSEITAVRRSSRSHRERPITPPVVDDYEILECVAQGGQGVVYRAIQKRTKRHVALKMLLGGHFATPRQRSRFEREVELAAGLHHPNIVTVHDSGITPDGRPFLSMEFIEGLPLDQWARSCRACGTGFQPVKTLPPHRRLVEVFVKICSALSYAHLRGVLHRDLKPGNILVDTNDEPHIVDFGLAKLVNGEAAFNATITGEFMGTIAYAAPEQVSSGDGHSDAGSDVYALGVLLYEALTGRLPYPVTGAIAEVVRQITTTEPLAPLRIDSSIPFDLDTIALKAMTKDLNRRYQSARDLGEDLRRFLANEPIIARSDSTWYLLRKTAHRYRIPVLFAGVFLVFLSAFAATMAVQARRLALQRDVVKEEKQRTEAALHESTLERARLVNASGNTVLAERLIWPDFLKASNNLYSADDSDQPIHLPTDPAYWGLWEIYARSPCLATVQGPNSAVQHIVFEDDGRTALVCFTNGAVWRWNTNSGQSTPIFVQPMGQTDGRCRLSMDGRNVIIPTDNAMEVWTLGARLQEPVILERPSVRTDGVTCKDNRFLAYENTDGRLVIYDLDSGQKRGELPAVSGNYHTAVFAARGEVLVTSSDDGHIRSWKVRTAELIAERTILEESEHDFMNLAAATHDRVAIRFRMDTALLSVPSLADIARLRGAQQTFAFSPRADRLGCIGGDQTIRLWKLADHSLSATYFGHESRAGGIAWSSDGERIASGDSNGVIKLWNATPEAGRLNSVIPKITDLGVSYSPDGRRVAVCSANQIDPDKVPIPITIWDARTYKKMGSLSGHTAGVGSIVFSPDGTRLASTGMDRTLRLWDVSREREIGAMMLPSHSGRPAFSPDGKRVVLGCMDGHIRVFDAVEQNLIATLDGHHDRVPSVDFRPNGGQFVSASIDRTAIIWDAQSLKPLKKLEALGGPLRVVRYNHNGRVFATGGDDWKVMIRDAQTGECMRVLERHRQRIFSLAFSPDDRILASGDYAGTIHLWDAQTGRNLATMDTIEEQCGIFGLDFSPDGRTLVAARERDGVTWWDLTQYDRHIAGNLEYQLRETPKKQ